MANHDDLNLYELKGLIEIRLKEFLHRTPEPSVILDLVLQLMEVIIFSRYGAALQQTADEDLAKEGYFKDAKGWYVKDERTSTQKGGDTHEGKDKR